MADERRGTSTENRVPLVRRLVRRSFSEGGSFSEDGSYSEGGSIELNHSDLS
ncbi:MAG TPA: hypothetical protein VMW72_21420 [Sedimentisphaerales bacterium]|nr:hypothetical protein [Sedimentisphaerales bacterium]